MTAPYYADEAVTLWHGDALAVLRSLPDASVDSVVTDPPYGLEFMGKEWDSFKAGGKKPGLGRPDGSPMRRNTGTPAWGASGNPGCRKCGGQRYGNNPDRQCGCEVPDFPNHMAGHMHAFQAWCELWSTECLRVLKPGGHMLAFGGSRTWHRLACAVEDAGFEIRDSIAWLYGSGFPKSLDVSKAIDRAAGAEREIVGRKAVSRMLPNDTKWGEGLMAGGVVAGEVDITAPATPDAERWQGWGTALKPSFEPIVVGRKPLIGTVAANVLAHGTGALNVDGCRVGNGEDRTSGGVQGSAPQPMSWGEATGRERPTGGRWPTNVILDDSQAAELDRQSGYQRTGTTGPGANGFRTEYVGGERKPDASFPQPPFEAGGGASRFFPTFRYEAKAPTTERPRHGETAHPTVKPVDLMRWLVRLVTPPGGTVLDPFAGSGTTAEACVVEGFRCVLIEREADYLPLIVQRLTKPIAPVLDFGASA